MTRTTRHRLANAHQDRSRGRKFLHGLAWTLLALAFLNSGAMAQTGEDADVILTGEGVVSLLRLALPEANLDPGLLGDYRQAAVDLDQTLRDDLEISGVFQVQGPVEMSVLTLTGDKQHDFEQYRSLGNQVVVLMDLKQEPDRLVLEGRVFDLPSGQSILGKRYRGTISQARQLAHTFADEIVRQFTGRSGIARTTIAFHSTRDSFQELYLMDYDGRNQRRLTGHKSTSGYPDWSAQGDAIAYITYFSVTPTIYYVDMASGAKVEVFGGGSLNVAPSFSPDGQMVAFGRATEANVDIYVCERQCRNPRRLTTGRSIDTNPVWSPNSQQIAFTSDRTGSPHVYVMDRDGQNIRRISFDGKYNDGAAWRFDGTHLAYASQRNGTFQIVVTNLVTLDTSVLTRGGASNEHPTFSPDGRRIAFTRKDGRNTQIFVMNADGSGLMQLTHEGSSFAPDWSGYPQ